jgi:hypothetical protein
MAFEFSEMDQMIIRNCMLSKSHKDIAELIGCDVKTVAAFIVVLIAGTSIVTRQMIIDQKKIGQKKPVAKKAKPISDEKIKEEWREQKEVKARNFNEHIKIERRKDQDRRFPKYKTLSVDTSRLLSVRIDDKTTIFIKPGEDAAAAKEQFFKNRIREKKSENIY